MDLKDPTLSAALSRIAPPGSYLGQGDVRQLIAAAAPTADFINRKVLLIVPDATRTAPVDLFFRGLHEHLSSVTQSFDVMIALGTHPPMSESAICNRIGITTAERNSRYQKVQLLNHEWDNPAALKSLGTISAAEISALSSGLFSMDVEVKINRHLYDYDKILIVGPVFPHEVVGFSGGNKYLFPGVSGPEVLNFFHWLGAVVTNPAIIGNKWTPVRKVVDRAGSMVKLDKLCFAMVVDHNQLAGAFAGTPESAWDAASELSRKLHITYVEKPFHTVLSCAPRMYDDLWTGGKCMYKLEPVVADGGELIIYAPHITEVSVTHGQIIEQIGYHCRDYFLKQWDKFKDIPWGVLAHSTHVRGVGTYDNGVEKCRIQVTVASQIPKEICEKINLGYRDPNTIRQEDFANQESKGVLLVPKAGEMLYHLKNPPPWARPS